MNDPQSNSFNYSFTHSFTSGFLMFSGGIERTSDMKWIKRICELMLFLLLDCLRQKSEEG